MDKNTQDLVNEALDAAVFEQQYVELMDYMSPELAGCLIEYDRRFEGLTEAHIVEQVRDYLRWYHDPLRNPRRVV